MSVVSISLNKVTDFNNAYFAAKYRELDPLNYADNDILYQLPFMNDVKYRKRYNRLASKLTDFLVSQDYKGNIPPELTSLFTTTNFEVVHILSYKLNMNSEDKFMKRPIPYAYADTREDMLKYLENFLTMEDPFEYEIYCKFKNIEWEENMYFEMFSEEEVKHDEYS